MGAQEDGPLAGGQQPAGAASGQQPTAAASGQQPGALPEPGQHAAEPGSAGPAGGRLSVGLLLTGLVLIAIGGLWLVDAAELAPVRWQAVLPAALLAVGVALLATARRTDHGGLIAAGIVLGVLVLATADPLAALVQGVGERTEQPADTATLAERYELGVGSLEVDLRDVDGLEDGLTVPASVGVGEVVVILPAEVGAEVDAGVGIGEVVVLGRSRGGLGVSASETVDGEPVLNLEVSAGIGRVEVRR